MKKLLVVSALAAAVTTGAFAGGADQSASKSQVVFGGDAGYVWGRLLPAQTGVLQNNPFNKTSDTEGHLAIGAHVGYRYTVMPKLSVGAELGYLHFGKTSVKAQDPTDTSNSYDYNVKTQLLTLLATVNYNVYQGLDVFVKGGPAYVFQTSNFDYYDAPGVKDKDLSKSDTIHKIKPLISVGASYKVHKIILGVSYDHLFGTKASSKDITDAGSFNIKNNKGTVHSANIVMGSIGYALSI